MRSLKASAIIVALMIVLILTITASGFFVVLNYSTQNLASQKLESELMMSAQAGATYINTIIKNANAEDMSDGNVNNINVPTVMPDPDNRFVDVAFTKTYDISTGTWSFTSKATNTAGDKSITIAMNGVSVTTYFKHAEMIFKLEGGYWTDGYNFWGDVWINNRIRVLGLPVFHGNVYTATKVNGGEAYVSTNSGGYSFYGEFTKGIDDGSSASEHNSDECLTDMFKGEYNGDKAKVEFPDIAKNWTEINEETTLKKYIVSNNSGAIEIVFKVDGGVGKALIRVGGVDKPEINLSDYDVIAVDGESTTNIVSVKGEVKGKIAVATKQASIHISDDIFYPSLSNFVDNSNFTNSHFYSDPANKVKAIELAMKNNTSDFCALMSGVGLPANTSGLTAASGKGCTVIDKNSGTDSDKPLIVSAALYSPYGEVRAVTPNDYVNGVAFITYGSIIANEEGYTSNTVAATTDKYEWLDRDDAWAGDATYINNQGNVNWSFRNAYQGEQVANNVSQTIANGYSDALYIKTKISGSGVNKKYRINKKMYKVREYVVTVPGVAAHPIGILMNPMTDWRYKAGMGPKVFNNAVATDGTNEISIGSWVITKCGL